MNKKGLKTILVCIVLLIGLVTLFACNKNDVADSDGQTKVIVKILDEDGSIYKDNVVFSEIFGLSLQKEGYTGKLYRDADFLKPLTKDSEVKNGDTVYVRWTINRYTVIFKDGETVLKTEKVEHGSAATAPDVPKKDGKTFVGWDKEFDAVKGDLTINAVYDVDKFTVIFKDGDKVLKTDTVAYKEAAIAPDLDTLTPPEGMHFKKWDKDFSSVTEDMVVSAVYEINVYTVIFKNGDEIIKTEKVEHGKTATAPNVVDSATKKFTGWDKPFDNVTSDIIVNARLENQKYTLTFIDHNGQEIHKNVLVWGTPVKEEYNAAEGKISIADPFGYVGWYDNADKNKTVIDDIGTRNMPTHDLTLVLKVELTNLAIGDFAVVNPKNFTYSENNSAKFTVTGETFAGVTYKYEWTILKDNEVYKTATTNEQSLTLQNLSVGKYFAKMRIVASKADCGSVEKSIEATNVLIVSRADISGITVKGGTFDYGDKNATIEINGLLTTDVVSYGTDGKNFTLENVDLSALDAGEYGYFVRIDRGDNYNPYTSEKITITINRAKVTVVVTPERSVLTYGDVLPSLVATIDGVKVSDVSRDKYTLRLKDGMQAITDGFASNVGEYEIIGVRFSHENYPEKNYEITLKISGTITINKAALSVAVDKINALTYGDELPETTYTFDGLKLSDTEEDFTVSVVTEYKKKADAGDYTLTVTVLGEKTKYYEITVNTVTFEVNKKSASIDVRRVQDIVYGDKVPDMSASVRGVLDGDSLSYTLETDYSVGAKHGYYNVNVVFDKNAEANKNYNISYSSSSFKVNKAALSISLSSVRVAVGKTYKVDAEKLTIEGLVAGDDITGYVEITKTEAGVYVAADFDKTNLVVKNADYYNISYDMSVEFVKVDFAIDFADVPVTYDGQEHGVAVTTTDENKNYTITYGTTEDGCTLSSSPLYKNAGVYTIYFKVVDNDSVMGGAEYVGHVTLTINKKDVTVKVTDVTITYGETPAFSYDVTGLVDGDKLSGDAQYLGVGTNAGEYDISVSGLTAGDNYTVSFAKGKLTINKKTAEVVWSVAENYVYSPDGQILPTATYDGNLANLVFRMNGAVCEFKNAGEYTVTVADDKNYILTDGEKTIVIEKARYTTAPALSLSGVYNPEKTLGNYALDEGFTWVDAGEIPVCTKTEYAAIYNKDRANYEDFEVAVTLALQKATVKLGKDLFEFNYDGTSHEISTTVTYNNVELTASLYTLSYGKNMFSDAGTHRTLVTMAADNYALPENSYVYVKVKGVKVGSTYYTIEDALAAATSGQTVFVLNDTAFASQEIAAVLYNDEKYSTVKTGVTLLLPFSENDTVGHIGAGEDGSDNYKATAALTGNAKLYKTLAIPEGVNVIVNGKLIVGAQTGKIAAGTNQNAVSGNYCEIKLSGTITLNSATLEVYGYIKGNGEITANNSTVIENLYLSGWMGGTQSAVRYIGNDKISGLSLINTGTLKIDSPTQFPFSQYELRAIQSCLIINKGSKLQGYGKIATNKVSQAGQEVPAQINEAILTFVSSDASNTSGGLFRLVGNNSKIVKSMSGDRVKIDLFGEIKDGYTSISILVIKKTVNMTSEKVFFPIDGRTDITLKNGATFTQSYLFKALPGATITVESGSVYNVNGKLIMYDKSFTDVSTYPYPGASRGDSKLIVDGTMNVNGALGGNVTSGNAGKVIVGTNATISDVHSAEGSGTMARESKLSLNIIFTYSDTNGVTKSLVFVNADDTTVAAAKNKTYTYNNGVWQ